MNPQHPEQWPQFFTATINEWKPLLQPDKYKNIITDSLKFLVHDNRIILNGFVIMNNHMHLIWQACHGYTLQKAQQSLMKYTAQQIKFDLLKNNLSLLEQYKINAADRNYCFWKRRSLGIELFTPKVYRQKLNYIHNNPVKAGLCKYPEQYHYSSAEFYYTGIDEFNMLTY
ncbi:MAG: transposase [Ferruginibacter sp.]